MLKQPELFENGFYLTGLSLAPEVKEWVLRKEWNLIDHYFKVQTLPGGSIFQKLLEFHDFDRIETMISIREAVNEWEEDGIWHDDGSRVFAFSLSLNMESHAIGGGTLELRRKNDRNVSSIPTPGFGTAILFLTGIHGFEHRTRKVETGTRIMLVGWCSRFVDQ